MHVPRGKGGCHVFPVAAGLHQVASLLSGLAKYRDAFVIDVVDSLLENIQALARKPGVHSLAEDGFCCWR